MPDRESKEPTPYAVLCQEGCQPKQRFLTEEFYEYQLDRPNRTWECPSCGGTAIWDDDNYEEHMKKLEEEQEKQQEL